MCLTRKVGWTFTLAAANLSRRPDLWPSENAFADISDIDIADLHAAEAAITRLDVSDWPAEIWRAWRAAQTGVATAQPGSVRLADERRGTPRRPTREPIYFHLV
jgi:hypothetical protein